MKDPVVRLAVVGGLAVLVSAMLLHLSTADDRLAQGLTFPPFAWLPVLLAHLALALPLAIVLGSHVRSMQSIRHLPEQAWAAIGLLAFLAVALAGRTLEEPAHAGELGLISLVLIRSVLSLAILLPWCALAARPAETSRLSPGIGLACAALAVVPPGIYADRLIPPRTDQARDLLERERLVRARGVLHGLLELGSDRKVGERLPADELRSVDQQIAGLENATINPVPSDAPTGVRLLRALQYIQLHRLDDAASLLEPLADGQNMETLLLGTVEQERERWRESDRHFESVLEARQPAIPGDPAASDACRTALEGLIQNAKEDRRPADVERCLQRALELFPERAAELRFQMGQHFAAAGRPARAIEEFQAAASIDPGKYGTFAEREINQLRTSTPACLLPGTGREP